MSELRDAALGYAGRGWAVYPVWWPVAGACACGTSACRHPAKHPVGLAVPRGSADATTDPATIRRWWSRYPQANVAIATGGRSRLVALDADGPSGRNALADLLERNDDDGTPAVSESGGGGLHLVYALPPGARAKSTASVIAFKVDVRGDGASFIAPPSVHITGRTYRWDAAPPQPGPAPAWLLRLIAPPPAPAVIPGPVEAGPIPEGQRNVALTSVAGRLRRAGLSTEAIVAALAIENAARCRPPLPEAEIVAIARSVGRYPAGPAQMAPSAPRLVVIRHGAEVAS